MGPFTRDVGINLKTASGGSEAGREGKRGWMLAKVLCSLPAPPPQSKLFPGHPQAMATRPAVPVAGRGQSHPSTFRASFLRSQGTFGLLVFPLFR